MLTVEQKNTIVASLNKAYDNYRKFLTDMANILTKAIEDSNADQAFVKYINKYDGYNTLVKEAEHEGSTRRGLYSDRCYVSRSCNNTNDNVNAYMTVYLNNNDLSTYGVGVNIGSYCPNNNQRVISVGGGLDWILKYYLRIYCPEDYKTIPDVVFGLADCSPTIIVKIKQFLAMEWADAFAREVTAFANDISKAVMLAKQHSASVERARDNILLEEFGLKNETECKSKYYTYTVKVTKKEVKK